ncbi:MAG: hypothetical protein JOZ96_03895 [Acidobacteria bacterium]|nr:hypothetical protein [Acidobacteriota bacterium]
MASIQIVKIDEDKSHFSDTNPSYVLVLSGKPDQNWKGQLEAVFTQSKNSQILNLHVDGNRGNELVLDTRKDVTPEQMLETVQGLVAKVNSQEEEFKNKLRELNKKLTASEGETST